MTMLATVLPMADDILASLMCTILKPFYAAPASLPGGYSVSEPPDPIPNSAVKPDSADGTIAQALEE